MTSIFVLIDSAFDTLFKGFDGDIESLSNYSSNDAVDLEAQLEILESAVDLVRTKTAALVRRIHTKIANVHKRRNPIKPPIYRIPVEILTEIMLCVIESSKSDGADDGRDKARSSIMNVSWHWFNIVISTPILSSFISSLLYNNKTRHLMRLSKDVTLDVWCRDQYSTDEADSFMRLVLPHIKRWRSFRLDALRPGDRSCHLPTASAPLLEKFEVNSTHRDERVANPFNGDVPRLRILDILPLPVSWDSPMLSGLTKLVITDIYGEDGQWKRRYYDLFKALPLLEHIHIVLQRRLRLYVTDSDEPADELKTEPIVLSRLNSMVLQELPSRIVITLLSSIVKVTDHCKLLVNFSHSKPWLFRMMSSIEPDQLLPSIIRRLSRLTICFKQSENLFRLRGRFATKQAETDEWIYPAELMLKFGSWKLPISPAANIFIKQLIDSSRSSLCFQGHVNFNEAGLDLAGIKPLQSDIENFTLSCNDHEDAVHTILQTLFNDGMQCNTGGMWPFAKLKRLELYGVRFHADRLHSFIKCRYGPDSPGGKAPLEELKVYYCGPVGEDEEEELERVLEEIEIIVKGQGGELICQLRDRSYFADLI